MKKLKLKNSSSYAVIDKHVYDAIKSDPALSELDFLNNLSLHSEGYAWAQKKRSKKRDGQKKNVAVYLHKWVAEHYVQEPVSDYKSVATFIDGDKLNCRVENIKWTNRSEMASLQHKKK